MKRLIDLRGQIYDDDTVGAFAWFDTISDTFEEHSGSQHWCSWEEFVGDYKGDDLDRYARLIPRVKAKCAHVEPALRDIIEWRDGVWQWTDSCNSRNNWLPPQFPPQCWEKASVENMCVDHALKAALLHMRSHEPQHVKGKRNATP